jgi:NADH:ubiquinone reductase (H+-translocating)
LPDLPARITVVDRSNHHLFQPLFYQVATAELSPADLPAPIRSVLRHQRYAEVVLDEVTGVDVAARHIWLGGCLVPYDYLVLATRADPTYFGHAEWARYAPGLKSISDATALRCRILLAFELAEMEDDLERRRALLTFVIVGGGPTGVELAGVLAELIRHSLDSDFRRITPGDTPVVLIETIARLLPASPRRSPAQRSASWNAWGSRSGSTHPWRS